MRLKKYTKRQQKLRALRRLAELFYDHWEEGRVGSSRVFEHIVPDDFVIIGQSTKGGSYREHIVPCALIRDECIRMYENNFSTADVVDMLDKYLGIVLLATEEAQRLDCDLKLKTSMPKDWTFGSGDALRRLSDAGITVTLYDKDEELAYE